MSNEFIEMLTLTKIDLGSVVLKPKTYLFIKVEEDTVYIKTDCLSLVTSKSVLKEKTNREFDELFISKSDADSATTYGSSIQLLTDRGLATYSVESISFNDKGISYATLQLKLI